MFVNSARGSPLAVAQELWEIGPVEHPRGSVEPDTDWLPPPWCSDPDVGLGPNNLGQGGHAGPDGVVVRLAEAESQPTAAVDGIG